MQDCNRFVKSRVDVEMMGRVMFTAELSTMPKPVGSENIHFHMTEEQVEGIRQRVRESIKSIERGQYVEYLDRDGLKKLSGRVKARGRQILKKA
jgi:hypothetical protein